MKVASNLKDFVYKSIESDILAGNLHSGDIINEKDLVEKYGVSKSPVRDALIALCADGILKSIPRYGYEIITYSVDGVYSMLQFRFVLESGFISRKIDTLTERQLAELEQLNEDCKNDERTPFEHWAANETFHLKLMSFWHNDYALQELRLTMNRLTVHMHSFTGTAIGMCCCQRILSIIPILSKVFERKMLLRLSNSSAWTSITSVASRISFSRHDKQNMKKSDIPPNREAKLLCPAVLFHEKNEISKILHTK